MVMRTSIRCGMCARNSTCRCRCTRRVTRGISENELYPQSDHTVTWWVYMWAAEDVKLGFTSFFQGGVFERFPGFKLVVTESGSGWLPHWLERMDEYYELFGFTTGMKMEAGRSISNGSAGSIWSRRRRKPIAPIELLGADRFLWAGDFPHSDSSADPVGELKENLSSLAESDPAEDHGGECDSVVRVVGGSASPLRQAQGDYTLLLLRDP